MGQDRGAQVVRACAVEMHLDVAQEALCSNLQAECQSPEPGTRLCASPRSRNAFGDFTRTICAIIYRWNAADQNRDPHFVRACAVEMHLDVSQEPFFWGEIYRENARTQMQHPRHTVWGIRYMYIFICTRIFPSTYPTYLPLFLKMLMNWGHVLVTFTAGRTFPRSQTQRTRMRTRWMPCSDWAADVVWPRHPSFTFSGKLTSDVEKPTNCRSTSSGNHGLSWIFHIYIKYHGPDHNWGYCPFSDSPKGELWWWGERLQWFMIAIPKYICLTCG